MRTRLALAALWALLAGCPGEVGSICELDEQCAEGLTCFTGTCQELGNPEGTVTFEVIPPPTSGLGPATFPMGNQPLRLGFCAPTLVEGAAAAASDVVIRGTPAGLPSAERRWQERVAEGPFQLHVPPGKWTLTFHFAAGEDGVLPPPEPREVELLGRCETVSLGHVEPTGEVRRARFSVVVDPERDPRPRCGVAAQIFDPASGAALSRPREIGSRQGQGCALEVVELPFRATAATAIELRLSPLGSLPTFADRRVAFPLPETGEIVDLGAVGVGDAALERIVVEVVDPDGASVPFAKVRAVRLAAEDGGRFSPPLAEPVAGEPGAYELLLVPGAYSVTAEPPAGVIAASSRCVEPAEGGTCDEALVVEPGSPGRWRAPLAQPLSLSGRLVDAERAPLPGARVTALPRGAGRRAETISGASGRYELLLDPGMYEVLVQAREPDAAWRRLVLETPLVDDDSLDFALPRAARVVGNVTATVGGRQVALARALVRAWRADGAEGPRVIGETVSDADGRFALALPAAR